MTGPSKDLRLSRTGPRSFLAVGCCFFASGLAALLYEVVWMRHLGLVFGHTVHALTTVLAAYMGGLALGSWLGGRWVDRMARPLRGYAALEAGIGVLCAATPLLLQLAESAYRPILRAWQPDPISAGLIHFALAAIVLLLPTTLMGATLPLLSRSVVEDARLVGQRVGALYALNTWGAVVGTVLAGFLLLPGVGLRVTTAIGVALNLLVAGVALLLDRAVDRGAQAFTQLPVPRVKEALPSVPAAPELDRKQTFVVLGAIAISGAASMAYEVAWTRALAMVLGSSTYAFTAMLATFLTGLALGAVVVSLLLGRRAPTLGAFGVIELAIAVIALALLPAFERIPDALLWLLARTGVTHQAALGAQFALSFLVMLGPTLAIGATFPLVIGAMGTALGRVGRDVGIVYGWNTVGTIVGAMLAGFVLVPAVGIQGTVRSAAAANVVAGLAVLAVAQGSGISRFRIAGAAGAVMAGILALALPRWDPGVMTSGAPVYAGGMVSGGGAAMRAEQANRELLLYKEGLSTTVAVVRSGGDRWLSVNGKIDAGTGRDMTTQLLLGHLGSLFVAEPKRALVIGLASGITAGAVAQHPFQVIDVAEIEPAMLEASRFFAEENRHVLADPRVRVLAGDGRQILAIASGAYDLIVSEPSNPWIAGVANLFTREFYESARNRLGERGVFLQWLQAYSIFGDDMRMVVRTFREVFPNVTIWAGSPGDVLLLATPEPMCIDPAVIEARMAASPGMRDDFRRFRWDDARLVFRFMLGEEDVERYATGGRINTDDLPLLEFSAPLALYAVSSAQENKAALRSFRQRDRPCVKGVDDARLTEADVRLRAADAFLAEGDYEEVRREVTRMGPPEQLDPELRAQRGRLLFTIGNLAEAMAEFSAVADRRPDHPLVRAYLMPLQKLLAPPLAGQVEKTFKRLPTGLFAEPGMFGDFLLGIALEQKDQGFLPLALAELDHALRVTPARLDVLNSFGVALMEAGRRSDATVVFRRLVELRPTDARARFNLAALLEQEGRFQEALREFEAAARLQPAWPDPRERAGRLRGLGPR